MKNPQFGVESIKLMAEGASILEPSFEVASSLSEEVTYRLVQIISRALKFMSHANRTRLTCADINKALKWSDCQPIFGHESNPHQRLTYSYSAEAQVFRYEDDIVDLVERTQSESKKEFKISDIQEAIPKLSIEEDV